MRLRFGGMALILAIWVGAVGTRADQNQPTVVVGGDGYYHLATCINVRNRVQNLRHIAVGEALRLNLSACNICEANKDPGVAAALPAEPMPRLGAIHKVIRIVDGDTVVLEGLGTVRLIGVDTPETVDPREPVEEFGRAATAFLTGALIGKSVRVEYDQPRTDRFNRILAYLYLADGTLVNREIVRHGYGHVLTEFPFKLMEDFRGVAREAEAMNQGLWAAGLGASDVKTIENAAPPQTSPATAPAPVTSTPKPNASAAKPSPPPAAARQQCAATTQKGARCSRMADVGSSYCWQHKAAH